VALGVLAGRLELDDSFTGRRSGSYSSTVVASLMSKGQTPTEWWMLCPGCGQPASTSRIREAPTTQDA
jgi:hypothetical protein